MTRIVRLLRIVSMLCLLFMMLLTGIDVLLRITLDRLIFGTVEMVELALVGLVFLALPETLWRDEQVSVDLIDQLMRPTYVAVFRVAAQLITVVLLAAMAWRMIPPALATVRFGDTTTDLQIPLIWHWIPIIVGVALSTIAAIVFFVRQLQTHIET